MPAKKMPAIIGVQKTANCLKSGDPPAAKPVAGPRTDLCSVNIGYIKRETISPCVRNIQSHREMAVARYDATSALETRHLLVPDRVKLFCPVWKRAPSRRAVFPIVMGVRSTHYRVENCDFAPVKKMAGVISFKVLVFSLLE
jgi:hypothetical protein